MPLGGRSIWSLEFAVELRRPERIFAVLALLIAAGVAWLIIDMPRDSGVRVSGTVEFCRPIVSGYETVPTGCLISIDAENRRVWVYMMSKASGRHVRLIEMRRVLTRRRFYSVDYTGKL